MTFPSFAYTGRALLVALALALLGYLLLPAGITGDGRLDSALLLAIGAFAGAWLAAIGRRAVSSSEGGKEVITLFVGNLAFKATEQELQELFAPYGTVRSARIMRDRKTRRPRGFGFVEMAGGEAVKAIRALDGKEFHGRKLRIKEGNRKEAEGGTTGE